MMHEHHDCKPLPVFLLLYYVLPPSLPPPWCCFGGFGCPRVQLLLLFYMCMEMFCAGWFINGAQKRESISTINGKEDAKAEQVAIPDDGNTAGAGQSQDKRAADARTDDGGNTEIANAATVPQTNRGRSQSISNPYLTPLFFKMAQNLDLRCVLVSAPWVLGPKHVSNPE